MTLEELNSIKREIGNLEQQISDLTDELEWVRNAKRDQDEESQYIRLLAQLLGYGQNKYLVHIKKTSTYVSHCLTSEVMRLLLDIYRVAEMQIQAKIRQLKTTLEAKQKQISYYLSDTVE